MHQYTLDLKYLNEHNMDANCKNLEKFINLITRRNIFLKYVINSKIKFQEHSSQIISILLRRYEKFA